MSVQANYAEVVPEVSGLSDVRVVNVYCDESCHLEHDRIPTMAWGAVFCPIHETRAVSESVRTLKAEHGLATDFEAKWTKISPAKTDFYLSLAELFLASGQLRFRGLVVPDKSLLDHASFDQSHDDWYYKMYFTMLRPVLSDQNRYRIYLDIKDTRGGAKTRRLREVLSNSLHDFSCQRIEQVQQIRSHESELLQITDLLVGALTYANRGLAKSAAKTAVIARLRSKLGPNALSHTSPWNASKFNILVWNPGNKTK